MATLTRSEIEAEVDRIIESSSRKVGLREHVLAWFLHCNGHIVNVTCPKCSGPVTVTDYPMKNGWSIRCPCGVCSGEMKGL